MTVNDSKINICNANITKYFGNHDKIMILIITAMTTITIMIKVELMYTQYGY